jgi:hypothetical protein
MRPKSLPGVRCTNLRAFASKAARSNPFGHFFFVPRRRDLIQKENATDILFSERLLGFVVRNLCRLYVGARGQVVVLVL